MVYITVMCNSPGWGTFVTVQLTILLMLLVLFAQQIVENENDRKQERKNRKILQN